jgi:hypothetical protein
MDAKSLTVLVVFFLVIGVACFFIIRWIRQQPQTSFWYRTRTWLPIVLVVFVVGVSGLNLFRYPAPIDAMAAKFEAALYVWDQDTTKALICPEDQRALLEAFMFVASVAAAPQILTQMKGSITSQSLTDAVVHLTAQSNVTGAFSNDVHLKYYGVRGWCIHETFYQKH